MPGATRGSPKKDTPVARRSTARSVKLDDHDEEGIPSSSRQSKNPAGRRSEDALDEESPNKTTSVAPSPVTRKRGRPSKRDVAEEQSDTNGLPESPQDKRRKLEKEKEEKNIKSAQKAVPHVKTEPSYDEKPSTVSSLTPQRANQRATKKILQQIDSAATSPSHQQQSAQRGKKGSGRVKTVSHTDVSEVGSEDRQASEDADDREPVSRSARVRQPSRKILESQLVDVPQQPAKKKRASASRSRNVSQSEEIALHVENDGPKPTPITSGEFEAATAPIPEVVVKSPRGRPPLLKEKSVPKAKQVTAVAVSTESPAKANQQKVEVPLIEPAAVVPSRSTPRLRSPPRKRISSINEPVSTQPVAPSVAQPVQDSTSIVKDVQGAGRDEHDCDLPEEHRPKERARPVMMGGRIRSEVPGIRKPVGRPYFQSMAGPSKTDDVDVEDLEGHVVEEGVIIDKVTTNSYTMLDDDGHEIVYAVGDGDYVEEVEYSEIPEGMEVIEEREIQNEDGTTSIIQSVAPREPPPNIDNQTDMGIKQEGPMHENEDDDDAPPRLVPELGPTGPEPPRRNEMYLDSDNMVRVQSPGGTQQFVHVARGEDGTEIYMDSNGDEVQMIEEHHPQDDLRTVEFNFLDSKNICCGLCGEIVPYDQLMSQHLPNMHAEVLGDGAMNLEEIPYETWLRDKLMNDKRNLESGFRAFDPGMSLDDMIRARGQRPLRKVSQIRVNPVEMTLAQLEVALLKKMVEKMGRKVPVALVDKQHARCGICNAVVSLNKKFEIVHLVRHFNAWHPSAHRCAGTWQNRPMQVGAVGKPLSIQDFAVIDVNIDAPDNLQCIWCGMFMDRDALAMHFTEVHPDEIEVPKCLLCLQEMVINARLLEKYGEDFDVILPDEFHVKCHKFEQTYSSELALDKAIARRVAKMQTAGQEGTEADNDEEDNQLAKDLSFTNSRMQFGRRNKPKRQFVQPCFRQAIPAYSQYVEAISECQWRCKLCSCNIFGAVISAGAIKHYKQHHPGEMENMQYELCKARLEKVSDGCMEFVHPQLVECLLCNLTYALHKPYNMCRGVRHLKAKHPEVMPEYTGSNPGETDIRSNQYRNGRGDDDVQIGETIDDPEMIARFKSEYNVDFEKVQTLYGADGEPVYVLLQEGEELDADTARQLATSMDDGDALQRRRPTAPARSSALDEDEIIDLDDEDDPYGHMAEEDEIAAMEERKENYVPPTQRNLRQTRRVEHVPHEDVVEEVVNDDMEMMDEHEQNKHQPPHHEGGQQYHEEDVEEYGDVYEDEVYDELAEGEEYLDDHHMEENFMEPPNYRRHPRDGR